MQSQGSSALDLRRRADVATIINKSDEKRSARLSHYPVALLVCGCGLGVAS